MSKLPFVHIELSAMDWETLGIYCTSLFSRKVDQIQDMIYAVF